MKMFHKVVFFTWCAFLIIFLLPSGGNSVLPRAPTWQFSDRSNDVNSISESERFAQYSYIITVNVTAINDENCHSPEQGKSWTSATCKSLNDALEVYGGKSSVVFYLVTPQPGEVYDLSSTYNVMNQHDIWFHGNNSSSLPQASTLMATVKCVEGVGLSFVNSSNIFFSNMKFLNCGSEVPISSASTNPSTERVKAGLCFYNCTNVAMHQVQVLNSPQAAGVIMYDTDGKIEICNSNFTNNSVEKWTGKSGGGGFAVQFTYCKPGDSACNDPYYRKNRNSIYSFHNCTFQDNVAVNSVIIYNRKAPKYYNNFDYPGQGGGLKINIKGDGMNNSFNLTDCQFFNNTAVWGGGLHITIDNQSSNNSIIISHCNFTNNSALFEVNDNHTLGGAMDIISTAQNFNSLHIRNCNIIHNRASRGGGMYLLIARQTKLNSSYVHHSLNILIVNCLLESNSAHVGSAMVICTFPTLTFGVLLPIYIHGSIFSNNHYLHLNTKLYPIHRVGTSVVHVSDIPVSFQNLQR